MDWQHCRKRSLAYFLYLFFAVFHFRETHILMHFLLLLRHSRQVYHSTKIAAPHNYAINLYAKSKFERFHEEMRQHCAVNQPYPESKAILGSFKGKSIISRPLVAKITSGHRETHDVLWP